MDVVSSSSSRELEAAVVKASDGAVKLKWVPGAGKGLFATRALSPGATVLRDEPVYTASKLSKASSICATCLVQSHRKDADGVTTLPFEDVCERCEQVAYCSAMCRRRDADVHGDICSALRQLDRTRGDREWMREMIFLAGHYMTRADRRFLFDHQVGAIGAKDVRAYRVDDMVEELRSWLPRRWRPTLTPEFLRMMIARMYSNDFTVYEYKDHWCVSSMIGTGNYGLSCCVNHSCNPSVYWTFDGKYMSLKCVRPIRKGEEIFLSYLGDLVETRRSRQKELQDGYAFRCACSRCKAEEAAERTEDSWTARSATGGMSLSSASSAASSDASSSHAAATTTYASYDSDSDSAPAELRSSRNASLIMSPTAAFREASKILVDVDRLDPAAHHSLERVWDLLGAVERDYLDAVRDCKRYKRIQVNRRFFELAMRWARLGNEPKREQEYQDRYVDFLLYELRGTRRRCLAWKNSGLPETMFDVGTAHHQHARVLNHLAAVSPAALPDNWRQERDASVAIARKAMGTVLNDIDEAMVDFESVFVSSSPSKRKQMPPKPPLATRRSRAPSKSLHVDVPNPKERRPVRTREKTPGGKARPVRPSPAPPAPAPAPAAPVPAPVPEPQPVQPPSPKKGCCGRRRG